MLSVLEFRNLLALNHIRNKRNVQAQQQPQRSLQPQQRQRWQRLQVQDRQQEEVGRDVHSMEDTMNGGASPSPHACRWG
jgi:hypothetical protein